MPQQIIPQVSTYAADIDNVIGIVGVLVGFWFLVALGAFFYLLYRYRYQEGVPSQYVDGSNPKHKRFISIPHNLVLLCDIVIIVAAVRVWVDVKQTLPTKSETTGSEAVDKVRIVAQQWAWSFVYPGADGKFDTSDDIKTVDELRVKVGTVTHYELVARDVLHSFSVPAFRLKQDAIPGRVVHGWFEPTHTGTYDLQCAEMCGVAHGIMFARVVVEAPKHNNEWMSAMAKAQGVPDPTAAAAPPAAAPAPATPGTATPPPGTPAPDAPAPPTGGAAAPGGNAPETAAPPAPAPAAPPAPAQP